MYHPWRALRHLTDWTLIVADLGDRLLGRTCHTTRTITLNTGLLQVERRSTIAHELEHVHRGPVPRCPMLAAREEAVVDQGAARALVTLDALVSALQWSRELHEIADELWVDPATVRTRMEHLHPSERAYIKRELGE